MKFVVLDGPDGGGKTTILKSLKNHYEAQHHKVILSKEPGGLQQTNALRELVLNNVLSNDARILLFLAGFQIKTDELILPNQYNNVIIFMDRWYYSTIAYEFCTVEKINMFSIAQPDMALIINVEPEVGLKRKQQQTGEINVFEEHYLENLPSAKRLQTRYIELTKSMPETVLINGNNNIDLVFTDCINAIERRIGL